MESARSEYFRRFYQSVPDDERDSLASMFVTRAVSQSVGKISSMCLFWNFAPKLMYNDILRVGVEIP